MSDCYVDANGCVVCPEQEPEPGTPSRYEQRAVIGWNAGSNTVASVDGDLHLVLPMDDGLAGGVVGLKGSRERNTLPVLIEHGWYFTSVGGAGVAQVMERGIPKTIATGYTAADRFEVRRQSGHVSYFKNATKVYTSADQSDGAKIVNACLYASGDQVGTG